MQKKKQKRREANRKWCVFAIILAIVLLQNGQAAASEADFITEETIWDTGQEAAGPHEEAAGQSHETKLQETPPPETPATGQQETKPQDTAVTQPQETPPKSQQQKAGQQDAKLQTGVATGKAEAVQPETAATRQTEAPQQTRAKQNVQLPETGKNQLTETARQTGQTGAVEAAEAISQIQESEKESDAQKNRMDQPIQTPAVASQIQDDTATGEKQNREEAGGTVFWSTLLLGGIIFAGGIYRLLGRASVKVEK